MLYTGCVAGPPSDPGVNIRAISRLFEVQAEQRAQSLIKDCTITVSVFEIYNERVRDLLSDASPDGSRSDLAIHQVLLSCNMHAPCTCVQRVFGYALARCH